MYLILFKWLALISLIVFSNVGSGSKWIKILVKGCRSFINKELWWNIDWYFIDHFSSFWEAQWFLVDRNQLFFNLFRFLMLLFHEIYQFFLWLFETLIIFIKLGLEFGLKEIFKRWIFRGEIKHFIFNVFWWVLVWLPLLFSFELYQFFLWLFKTNSSPDTDI